MSCSVFPRITKTSFSNLFGSFLLRNTLASSDFSCVGSIPTTVGHPLALSWVRQKCRSSLLQRPVFLLQHDVYHLLATSGLPEKQVLLLKLALKMYSNLALKMCAHCPPCSADAWSKFKVCCAWVSSTNFDSCCWSWLFPSFSFCCGSFLNSSSDDLAFISHIGRQIFLLELLTYHSWNLIQTFLSVWSLKLYLDTEEMAIHKDPTYLFLLAKLFSFTSSTTMFARLSFSVKFFR